MVGSGGGVQRSKARSTSRSRLVKVEVKVKAIVEVKIKAYDHILKSLSQRSYFKVIRTMVIGVEGQGH